MTNIQSQSRMLFPQTSTLQDTIAYLDEGKRDQEMTTANWAQTWDTSAEYLEFPRLGKTSNQTSAP